MERIFEDIVQIMQNDYAGWKDKQGWDDPDFYRRKIKELNIAGQLNDEVFTGIIHDYLLDFNDKHIFFKANNINDIKIERGFRVRRYEKKLYVIGADQEDRVLVGEALVTVGGFRLEELKRKHARILKESHAERENWEPILALYDFGEIEENDGSKRKIVFRNFHKKKYKPTYKVEKVNNNLLITITDFMNPDAIISMINDNQVLMEETGSWIIDVRLNLGGNDASYFPLLPYLMPVEGIDLADNDEKMLFNCTVSNAEREINLIKEQIEEIKDENTRNVMRVIEREWMKNKGRGFIDFDFQEILPSSVIKGKKHPLSIVVLTDNSCGSAGDSFVETVKKSSKVTVMGRPTLGLNDYANLSAMRWANGFEFWYPTSRLSRIDNNNGMTGIGIQPHIYIPWTPEHLESDVDMSKVLEFLEEKAVLSIKKIKN